MSKEKRNSIITLVVIVIIIAGVFVLPKGPASKYKNLEAFAQCLTDKGAVMYGAYWCSHCKAQKAMFGSAFDKVNYVECTAETERCTKEGVTGYPTWKIASTTLTGEQPLDVLGDYAGCPLELK